jgi:subtilisin family serine protease
MRRTIPGLVLFLAGVLVSASPANATQRFIVRTTSLPLLQKGCLLNLCNVVQTLDGGLGQVFLVEFPGNQAANLLLNILRVVPGVLNAEIDVLQNLAVGGVPMNGVPAGLNERTPTPFYGSMVWSGYAFQPASTTIRLADARAWFHVTGAATVADIDTGVDPNHPALVSSLLPGYDFTRNQPGGSEMTDVPYAPESDCSQCPVANINKTKMASATPSTGAVLDSPTDDGFGHGTMVLGIVHLVAPTARLLPLKAFRSDGTGYTSDIIRAIYYAVQNHANVINMSFDFMNASKEFADAIAYAGQNGVVCVASAGNDGAQEVVYPAALKGVMGVASVNDSGGRSTFSNYGTQVVWVAAPGENIITTFPYGSYAAGSGTSFSAPLVSGTVALILNVQQQTTPAGAAADVAHAQPLAPNLGHGLLDVYLALQAAQYGH